MSKPRDSRPNPDSLLAQIEAEQKARLRVYIGASPGVGKTYEMLTDGHLLRKQGYDIVIGIVETYGRTETIAQIRDLEIIPRKKIAYRNVVLEEMDLAAIIARKPQICIVDELAHTNVPGSKNKKRFEDVLDLLDAGISVMTAVNIQHLETLNDAVQKSAGIKVRETVPDIFLERADEVINVDISVEELRRRLKQGKIYQPDKIEQSLKNFFRIGNLSTLRELSLRTVAEVVGTKAAQYREREGLDPAVIPEKVMVCMSSSQTTPRLLRVGARIAGRLGALWYAVYIETVSESPQKIKADDAQQLANNIVLAEQLGAEIVKLQTNQVADGLIAFAKREGITHVIFGQTSRSRWEILLRGSVIDRFLREVSDAAVQIIPTNLAIQTKPRQWLIYKDSLPYLIAIGGEVLVVGLFKLLLPNANNTTVALTLLLIVQILASVRGLGPSLLASLIGMICFNFFFLPPVGTLTISDPQNLVALTAFVITAGITSHLSASARTRAEDAEKRRTDVWKLYDLGRSIIGTPDSETAINNLAQQVLESFKLDYCAIFTPNKQGRLQRTALATVTTDVSALIKDSVLEKVLETGELRLSSSHNDYYAQGEVAQSAELAYIPLKVGLKATGVMVLTAGSLERGTIDALAGLVALALERGRFLQEVSHTETLRQSDRLKSAILASVSHNLRTPLTSIRTCIDSLLKKDVAWDEATREEFLTIISEESYRLNQIVTNLLEMARIEAGELSLQLNWTAVAELFTNALERCSTSLKEHKVVVDLPENLPLVKIDGPLLMEALVNLLENAAKYSPKQTQITLSGQLKDQQLIIKVQDQGIGISEEEQEKIFEKFYRAKSPSKQNPGGMGMGLAIARGIVELHGGKIWVESKLATGATFICALPMESTQLPELLPEGSDA